MMPGDRLYDPAQDKQWSSAVYQKAKQAVEEKLSTVGGVLKFSVICEAFKQKYPQLCDDSIKDPSYPKSPYWKHLVATAISALKGARRLKKADGGWIWTGEKSLPPPTPPKRHDELKQKMIYVGKKLGYHVSAEEGALYRHDVLWKQGAYKSPCHVIEICEGGSLPKDFDALHWANDPKNWGAKGILIVTDDKDFEKAVRRFVGQGGLIAVKAETVDALCKIVDENPQFLELIYSKES